MYEPNDYTKNAEIFETKIFTQDGKTFLRLYPRNSWTTDDVGHYKIVINLDDKFNNLVEFILEIYVIDDTP